MQEVHDVLRRMWRSKLSTAGLVALIALSSAISACVFSVTWAMLWKPLPFRDQADLVNLTLRSSKMGIDLGWSAPYLDHIERNSRQLRAVASYREREMQRAGLDGRPIELVKAVKIEPVIFSELGASPVMGRPLLSEDAETGSDRVVIVSYAFWQSRLQGATTAVGQKLLLDGDAYTVVGVMPSRFTFPSPEVQLWVPYALTPQDVHLNRAGSFGNLRAIGRLVPGSTYGSATSEMANLVAGEEGLRPIAEQIGLQFEVKPLRSIWVQDRRPSLVALLTAAVLLLVVAGTNAYSLFLVRQLRRRQEFALLEAVGETSWRRLRRVAIEALLITLTSILVACLLLPAGLAGLSHLDILPKAVAQPVTFDLATALFLVGVCVLSTIVLASSAVVFRQQRVYEVLRQSGNGQSVPGRLMVQKKILVICQLAAVFVLLFVTALLMKSSYRLLHEQLGFQRDGTIVGILQPLTIGPSAAPEVVRQRLSVWLAQVSHLPGVSSAGFSSSAPFGDNINLQSYISSSGTARVAGADDQAYVTFVSPGYVQALGLRVLTGRSLEPRDERGDALVALIDRTIAETNFPEGPLGRMIAISDGEDGDYSRYTIVGVVDRVRQRVLAAPDEYPTIYLPQAVPYALPGMPSTAVEFVVRADKPAALLKHIEALTDEGATGLRISNLVTMEKRIGDTVTDRIKLNQLLQAVSAAALILAAAGLYALLAHLVISRGRELAIRKALGATPRDLLVDSLSRGLKVVALGVICGLPIGLLCASWLRSRLYATSPFDLVSVVLVVSVLLIVGLVATLRPAFVAAQVSPMDVLRAE